MLFLWINKTLPESNSHLSFQEGFNRYQLWKFIFTCTNWKIHHFKTFTILKISGGAVLLLWANTFSPFDMNRQKRILEWNISPLLLSPLWQTIDEWRFIPKTESCSERRRRVSDSMEWSGSLCLRRRLLFHFNLWLGMKFSWQNTLVIAKKEIWSKVYQWAMCAKHQ